MTERKENEQAAAPGPAGTGMAIPDLESLSVAGLTAAQEALRRAACASLMRQLADMAGLAERCPAPACRRKGACCAEEIDDNDPLCRDLWPDSLFTMFAGGLTGINFALAAAAADQRRRRAGGR